MLRWVSPALGPLHEWQVPGSGAIERLGRALATCPLPDVGISEAIGLKGGFLSGPLLGKRRGSGHSRAVLIDSFASRLSVSDGSTSSFAIWQNRLMQLTHHSNSR
jgi:hypothetical protein